MINKKTIYLSGLNGIRTIAAFSVMISHINLSLISFKINNISLFGFTNGKQNSWSLGEQGVTMFFVLSGFLITYLLIQEKDITNNISIQRFYIRRILRIWPLYFFYLIITLIIVYLFDAFYPNITILIQYIFLLANIPFILNISLKFSSILSSISIICFKRSLSNV